MTSPDAAIAEKQIRRMARSVCPDDPRTLAQRRGDAHAALMAGSAVLKCACGNPDCAAANVTDAAAVATGITVITDQATLDAALAAAAADAEQAGEADEARAGEGLHGPRNPEDELGELLEDIERDAQHEVDTRVEDVAEPPLPDPAAEAPVEDDDAIVACEGPESNAGADGPVPNEPGPEEPPEPDEPPVSDRTALAAPVRPLAIIPGHGAVPLALLADLVARGAQVRPIDIPSAEPDPGYRPSAATARFVRDRDLTCRAPGCDQPAEFADLDHTDPYPAGATHAGGLKCDCRKHHLIKTFHAGWSEKQFPDGTVVITTPTGHSYTTKPGIALFFPKWNVNTPAPPANPATPPSRDACRFAMPKRKRTRAQAKADRITAERKRNQAAEQPQEPQVPPPF